MISREKTRIGVLGAALLISLLLHLLIWITMHKDFTPAPAERPDNAVKIRLVEKKPVLKKTPVSKEQATAVKGVPKSAPVIAKDEEEDEEEYEENERPYENLFPGPSWPSGTVTVQPGSSTGDHRGPPPSTGAQKITAHLSGQLDIPLVFRENTAQSRAVAKFRKKNDRWYFEYIDGEPVLRAVLYQAFQQKKNLDKIEELAGEMKKQEIIFVLEQLTKPALDGWEQFSDAISYEGIKVIYSRTIFTGSDGSSGMALPDKEAERAVMRDKVALKRLMDSPAYFSPIRNRLIDEK